MKAETLNKILNDGIKAPSGDNLQPWEIEIINNNKIKLFMKKEDDFFNVENVATYTACGAFIENIIISSNDKGYNTKIKINNNKKDTEICEIIFSKGKKRNTKLAKEINNRATIREPYKIKKFPKKFFQEINKIKSNAKIKFYKNEKEIIQLLYDIECIRLETYKAHKTLFENVRYSKEEVERTKNGLDYRSLGIPFAPKLTIKILSNWRIIKFLSKLKINKLIAANSSKKLLKKSAGIGIISINKFNKKEIIEAGMLFERIWLIITKYKGSLQPYAAIAHFGLNLEYLNGEGFSEENKIKIKNITKKLRNNYTKNQEIPIMIFRFGFSKKPKIIALRKKLKNFIKNT